MKVSCGLISSCIKLKLLKFKTANTLETNLYKNRISNLHYENRPDSKSVHLQVEYHTNQRNIIPIIEMLFINVLIF